MNDPQFIDRLEQYIAAGNANTLAAQMTWEELRDLGDLLRTAADLVEVARVQRARLDEGTITTADLARDLCNDNSLRRTNERT